MDLASRVLIKKKVETGNNFQFKWHTKYLWSLTYHQHHPSIDHHLTSDGYISVKSWLALFILQISSLRKDNRLEVNKSHIYSHSTTCHHLCSVSNMLMFSDLECITHTGPSTGWLVLDGKLRRSSYFGSPAAAKCAASVSQYPCTQCQKISRIKILFRMQFLKHCHVPCE